MTTDTETLLLIAEEINDLQTTATAIHYELAAAAGLVAFITLLLAWTLPWRFGR